MAHRSSAKGGELASIHLTAQSVKDPDDYVTLEDAYIARTLYQPVWITGRMWLQKTNRNVNYSDGQTAAEAAYTLEGVTIEPYHQRR